MSIGRIVSMVIGSSVIGFMSGPVLAQDAVKIGLGQLRHGGICGWRARENGCPEPKAISSCTVGSKV